MKYELKKRLLKWFIHHNNLINKGIGLLYTPKQIAQYVLGISVLLKLFIDPSAMYYIYVNVGIGILFLAVGWSVGWWWDKSKAYDMEHEWGNQRNPFVSEMRNAITSETEYDLKEKEKEEKNNGSTTR